MQFGAIVPSMPDVVLRRIFDSLTYKELCRFEFDFLSGVLRRSRLYIRKLSCDLRFLANLDQLKCDRERNRRYWSNVEEVWLVISKLNEQITDKFLAIESDLFLNLSELTVQIHQLTSQADNADRVLSAIISRFPSVFINMELHAITCDEIYYQLHAFSPTKLNKLKLVCVAYEPSKISLTRIARNLKQSHIDIRNFTLRDWCIECDPNEPLFHNAINTFRISSCNIDSVDKLASALQKTVQVAELEERNHDDRLHNDNQKREKMDRCDSLENFIERLEVAGQCIFHGLDYLNDKAHIEFEYRIHSRLPSLEIDCSDIYYYD
ncbi:unnamed protein product [Anisakis simplex]|uniref:Uncharacterized F-box protein (inferred by orthology to a C. elegans protein) n=1 Tax=Anisakis simplex TaxID=6269 RepID=A0A0M3JX31_ANISI|nr:unnamed protein product [Anisakis simplex]